MGRLSSHVLDTVNGIPAAGVRIQLFRGDGQEPFADLTTNADGRTEQPLLSPAQMQTGEYQLLFHLGDYFREQGSADGFLDIVPVRFTIADASANYHVPLLASPWSYTTYRGS